MLQFAKITNNEFSTIQSECNLILGEKKSNYPDYYKVVYQDKKNNLLIGIINNYPNMDLDPQIEINGNYLIIGNNDTLTIDDIETKERKSFHVFPVFYKFIISGNRIIVLSEVGVFCLFNYELDWSNYNFKDMISFERFEDNKLVVSTYEDQKEITIDINTGKII